MRQNPRILHTMQHRQEYIINRFVVIFDFCMPNIIWSKIQNKSGQSGQDFLHSFVLIGFK